MNRQTLLQLEVLFFLTLVVINCRSVGKTSAIAEVPVEELPLSGNPRITFMPPRNLTETIGEFGQLSPFDRTDKIINQSRLTYLEGEQELKEGFLDKAQRKFDGALEIILHSELEIKKNKRLNQHYQGLLDRIHGNEVAFLKERGNITEGFLKKSSLTEALSIDLPLTFDFSSRPLLKENIGLVPQVIPLPLNASVRKLIRYYQKRGRKTMELGMKRAGRYRYMISRILAEEGLPQELIYLCQIESIFNPRAYSRAQCKGLWQFRSGTATTYDLRQNWWIDERSDPEKSTRAAARYLRDLYEQFGNWLLVMAAYNVGASGVERAIAQTGQTDFWQLRRREALPRETRNFVPMILTTMIISKDPIAYGFQVEPDLPIKVEKVRMGTAIDLRLVSEVLEISVAEVRALNPHIRRMTTPPQDLRCILYVPEGSGGRLMQEIEEIPEDARVTWRKHRIREGETLSQIAKAYQINTEAISLVNGISGSQLIIKGHKLIIPLTFERERIVPFSIKGRRIRYVIQKGDTITSVAGDFDVSIASLCRWNKLKRRSRLLPGRRLTIYAPKHLVESRLKLSSQAQGGSQVLPGKPMRVMHRIKEGDTLSKIARDYKTTISALCKLNDLSRHDYLRIGKELIIHSD